MVHRMPIFTKTFGGLKYYMIAITGVIAAAVLRYALGPTLGGSIPVVLFTVPVAISAFYGGFWPAMLATVSSALISTYLFIPPYYSLRIEHAASAVVVTTFLAIGLTISLLGKKLKELQVRTEQQALALKEENNRKDEFLAMLAHELRNPLAGISTAAELLRFGHLDEKRLTRTSEVISRQVVHMVKLVDDLLDVSRLTRGLVIVDKKPVNLNDIVHSAIDQTRSLFDEKGHKLILQLPSEPACVCGDHTRLVQVVANLLGNAAKYTPEYGEVTLMVKVETAEVQLTVQDNGLGMTEELLSRVFEPFVQAERGADRAQGGLGLGLAVVQKITHLHDGSITAHSGGPGQGSTFTLELPHWKKPPATSQSQPGQMELRRDEHGAAVRSLALLVVDDNRDAANGLAAILESRGHTVTVAYDARQALDLTHRDDFDAFLLDIGLPDVDGYELLEMLKSIPHLSGAIFMALSGYGTPEDMERSKAAGFYHHFVKPLDTSRLLAMLNQISATR